MSLTDAVKPHRPPEDGQSLSKRPTPHPLQPLSPEEITEAVGVLGRDRRLGSGYRFVAVELQEPDKELLARHAAGEPIEREAHAVLLDRETGGCHHATVSLPGAKVTSWEHVPGVQPAVMLDEFFEVEEICKRDPLFREVLAKRGITDMDRVCVDPWSSGFYGDDDEGRRLLRALIYTRRGDSDHDNPYAHPIDNLVAIFDANRMEVVAMEDHGVLPVPEPSGNYAADLQPSMRDIRPIEILQPEGPSFELDGWSLSWQKWRLRLGFTPREGVVLHQVVYQDGDTLRPVLHRAALSEMVVPYGDPGPVQAKKNAFDAGEYNIGQLTNSLTLGCDCLGEIRYLDAVVVDSHGKPVVIDNAVCLHEEDVGILWKHTDFRTEDVEVRRSRRMVISFIATVANYEYGFYWYLYQDGTIELEIKLSGVVSTAVLPHGIKSRYGQLLNRDGLYAPVHQHLFNVRIDLDVDGTANSVYEVDITPADPSPTANPYGNAFYPTERLLDTELAARRMANPSSGRHWKIVNHQRRNAVGDPVGYRLIPTNTVTRFAHPEAHVSERAGFTSHHLWVTPYEPAERYAAGDHPNQDRGGSGLPSWTEQDRSLVDADVVLWHTLGSSHLVRMEDWPVMPVQHVGFKLEPVGFFDRNPSLDVPPTASTCSGDGATRHCSSTNSGRNGHR